VVTLVVSTTVNQMQMATDISRHQMAFNLGDLAMVVALMAKAPVSRLPTTTLITVNSTTTVRNTIPMLH
jgi:hypothetical protein